MDIETASKVEILRRIRAANHGASTEGEARSAWETLPRNYKQASDLKPEAMLELFEDRLRDYDATVTRTSRHDLAHAVATQLIARSKRRLVVPVQTPPEWLPQGFTFVVDEGLTPSQLDAFDGVLTGATLAIAETGTLILQNPGQGRRALSLVPDYHLCIVSAENIVETVPQAFHRLQSATGRATTFISGPSATADIEMTRIKGVHGPRVLDVILIV
jgi:L-lactate dehydrogenase complex protein LldG